MADRQFVVEAIFRAQDQLSRVIQSIQGSAQGLGRSFSGPAFAQSGAALQNLTSRVQSLGSALSSGQFLRAATEAQGLAGSLRVTSTAASGAAAATGAMAGEAGVAAGGLAAIGGGATVAIAGVGALVVGVGVLSAKLIEAADAGARYADTLGDLATRTGIGVESLTRLAFAAQQSDVDLQSLATGIKFLSKNLIEAKTGAGDAHEALIGLGFTGDQIAAGFGNTEQALAKLSVAFGRIEDPALRTSLALKIFGRSGEAMIPLLIQTPEKMAAFRAEADRLGITVTQLAAKIGDDYTHALERLKGAQTGLAVQISTLVTPTMTKLIDHLTDMVAAINAVSKSAAGATGFKVLGETVRKTLEGIFPLLSVLEKANNLLQLLRPGKIAQQSPLSPATAEHAGRSSDDVTRDVAAHEKRRAAIEATAAAAKKAGEEAARAAEALAKEQQKLRAEYEKTRDASWEVSDAIVASLLNAIPSIKAVTDAIAGIQKELNSIKAPEIRVPEGFEGSAFEVAKRRSDAGNAEAVKTIDTTPLPEIAPDFGAANEAGRELVATFEALGIPIDALNAKLAVIGPQLTSIGAVGVAVGEALDQSLRAVFDPTRVAVDGVRDAVAGLGQQFDQVFTSAIAKLIPATTAMRGMAGAIGNAMLAMARFAAEIAAAIIKALILKAIMAAIGLSGGGAVKSGASTFSGSGTRPQALAGGGMVAHLAEGGGMTRSMIRLQGFAHGGGVGASFLRPVHAAYGLALPGGPSWSDNIPAMLSAGEYVVPNSGSSTGTDTIKALVAGVASMREAIANMMSVQGAAPSGGDVHVHVNAMDSDSVRNSVRPGGSVDRELARASELGRSSW